jgi:hypothetical protein
MHREDEKMHANVYLENLIGRDHLGDFDMAARIIKTDLKKIVCWVVNWIEMAQDRIQW